MKWTALLGDHPWGEENRLRLAVLLTAAAAVLLGVAVLQARLAIGPLGLVHSFPRSFYVGCALLLAGGTCLWTISRRCAFLAVVQVVLLITCLWLVPVLLSGTPRFGSAYKAFGFADYIIRFTKLNPDNWQFWYHNWPGSSILVALIMQLLGPGSGRPLLMFYPYGLNVLMLLPLWWLLRQGPWHREMPNAWAAGATVFFLGNFINQDYLSPQSFGLFLLACALALALSLADSKDPLSPQTTTGLKLVLILVFCTLAVSHVLSSLVAMAVMSAYALVRRQRPVYILLLGLVVLTAWNLAGASVYFEANFLSFLQQLVSFQDGWDINITQRMSGSVEHLLVNKMRLLYCALFGIIGGLGFMLGWRKWRRKTVLIIMMPALPTVVLCGVMPYGGESYMRLFLFSLFALAFFSLGLVIKRWGAVTLCVVLISCCPLFMVAKYGNASGDDSQERFGRGRVVCDAGAGGGCPGFLSPAGGISERGAVPLFTPALA